MYAKASETVSTLRTASDAANRRHTVQFVLTSIL
jgi:hypothetical protein